MQIEFRGSADTDLIEFGRSLLATCFAFDLHLLNGTAHGDEDGSFYLCIIVW